MRVVTREEIRALDGAAIDVCGIPGVVLMENAGAAVVATINSTFGELSGRRIAIFCGAGNNGGDGFVVARRLLLQGAIPTVFLMQSEHTLRGDAFVHFRALKSCSVESIVAFEANSFDGASHVFDRFDLYIDALLGTGLKGKPGEPYASAIAVINRARGVHPIYAIDVPSGIDFNTGGTAGAAVDADHTITFAYPKIGLFLPPGSDSVGRLHIADIGFDWKQIPESSATQFTLTGSDCIQNLLGRRRGESNKGDYGHVAIIAGSRGMAGAPALVARAAQRSGAGLVTVLTCESAQPTVAGKLDEQMTVSLLEEDGAISESAFDRVAEYASRVSVLCIGPGLTTHPGTVRLVSRVLREIEKPIVLDADGLNALATNPEAIKDRNSLIRSPLILTPHPGEAARLLGTSISNVQSDRVGSVRELAIRYGACVLLKGRFTLIASPDGAIAINSTGNPGMATGGMGDALTGVVGGIVAQLVGESRNSPGDNDGFCASVFQAVAAGAYIHGLAGDVAARASGEIGLTAGDVIASLPEAFGQLTQRNC